MKKVLRIVLAVLAAAAVAFAALFAYLYFNGLSGVIPGGRPAEGQIRVACVGDSVTYGHGVSGWPDHHYPAVLSRLLGGEYFVQNFGYSGRAVQPDSDQPYTATSRYRKSLDFRCDVLVFMMGSNDSKPENWTDAQRFEGEFRALLDSYLSPDGGPELILCTPPTAFFAGEHGAGLTSFDIQPGVVDGIADIVRAVAGDYDCRLVDVHALTRDHPEWFSKDGVHPNQDGAQAIAQAVFDAIRGGA